VEVIRNIYGPGLIPTFSSDIEIAVDVPEAEKATFTLVSNKKYKEKSKASFFYFMFFSDFRDKTSLISWVS